MKGIRAFNKKNNDKAYNFFLDAVEKKEILTPYGLGNLERMGKKFENEQNLKEALKWYKLAEKFGSKRSKIYINKLYKTKNK